MFTCGKVQTWLGLGLALVTLVAVQVPVAQAQAQPIAVTGWNTDVILDADITTRFAIAADNGNCTFFESSAVGGDGVQRDDGLPAGMTFLSLTGNAIYQLQPANGNNVLQLYHLERSTLTLVTPAAYSQLFVIATAGSGDQFGIQFPGVVRYDDGSTLDFTYNCFDWCNSFTHPEAAIAGLGRACSIGDTGDLFNYNFCSNGTGLYETQIDTDKTKTITSIDFSGFPSARGGHISSIFAVSGQ
jgi:hypothetical protein